MNWWESLIVNNALSILRATLRKPGQAAKIKHVSLDIYQAIKAAYAGDPDFN